MKNKDLIKLLAKIELSRNDFWFFCKTMCPKFYTNDKIYLKKLCYCFQEFYESNEYDTMVISIGPRHGKTLTSKLFCRWILGKNQNEIIMTASYNTTLSEQSSKEIRDEIAKEKIEPSNIVNSDVFPNCQLKFGSKSSKKWQLDNSDRINFLATAPNGTATGFGCSILLVDDILKNASEAYNEKILEKIWDWYTNTMMSRVESGGKSIFIATRWAKKDLSGRILEYCRENGKKVMDVNFKLFQDDGSLLPGTPLTKKMIQDLQNLMSKEIFSANYNQEPIDSKDRLYSNICTYKTKGQVLYNYFGEEIEPINCVREIPQNTAFDTIRCYIDTADKGQDYLCAIIYGLYNQEIYILDIVYSQQPMQFTSTVVAECLQKNKVSWCDVEGNNGGEGYALEVLRILKEYYKNDWIKIRTFHQGNPKDARIRSMVSAIERNIYMPVDWNIKWKEFSSAILEYKNLSKNLHDDAPDALTGVIEKMIENGYIKWIQ